MTQAAVWDWIKLLIILVLGIAIGIAENDSILGAIRDAVGDYDYYRHPSAGKMMSLRENNFTVDSSSGRKSSVRFVPYPHRPLPVGPDAACEWSAFGEKTDTSSLIGQFPPDAVQAAALSEGICLPEGEGGRSSVGSDVDRADSVRHHVHVFSSDEAIRCLSPKFQKGSVELIVSGDSYNQQLFIGLADVLLSDPANGEINNGTERKRVLAGRIADLAERSRRDASFPRVRFACEQECRGELSPFGHLCSECINAATFYNPRFTAAVVGAGVHIVKAENMSWDGAVEQVGEFLNRTRQVVFNSMPCYQTEKIPPRFRNATHHVGVGGFYMRTLAFVAPHRRTGHPFLDFFQLTKSCHMENCSYDGGHRSRYVNRWKAQLLLNMLCEVSQ